MFVSVNVFLKSFLKSFVYLQQRTAKFRRCDVKKTSPNIVNPLGHVAKVSLLYFRHVNGGSNAHPVQTNTSGQLKSYCCTQCTLHSVHICLFLMSCFTGYSGCPDVLVSCCTSCPVVLGFSCFNGWPAVLVFLLYQCLAVLAVLLYWGSPDLMASLLYWLACCTCCPAAQVVLLYTVKVALHYLLS